MARGQRFADLWRAAERVRKMRMEFGFVQGRSFNYYSYT